MTHPNPMPDNPGEPEHTDPEVTSPDRAEAAAEEAASAQGGVSEDAGQTSVDPALEAEIEQALADIDSAVAGASEEEESQTADVETQLAELTDDLKRISAEYANYRRRTERERQGIIDSAKSSVLIKLLPVLDDLDLAAQHGDLEAGPLKVFADKLTNSLSGMSLESFGAEGDAFDPEIHEAVQDLSNGEGKALGTILRRGYRIGDKLVRTAMVIIVDPAEQATHGDNA